MHKIVGSITSFFGVTAASCVSILRHFASILRRFYHLPGDLVEPPLLPPPLPPPLLELPWSVDLVVLPMPYMTMADDGERNLNE